MRVVVGGTNAFFGPATLLFAGADLIAFAGAVTLLGHWMWHDVFLAGLTMGMFGVGGLYRSRLSLSVLDDLPALIARELEAGAITATGTVAFGAPAAAAHVLLTAGSGGLFVVAGRTAIYDVVRRARARDLMCHRALILGTGRIGRQLAQLLLQHPCYGLRPVGFLDRNPSMIRAPLPLPLLGDHRQLSRKLTDAEAEVVIVAFGSAREASLVDVIRTCDRLQCEIFVVPRLFEMNAVGRDTDWISGLPLIRLSRAPFRAWPWRVKRLLDIVFSVLALVVLAPLLLASAIAVRLETGPGILFHQQRTGLDGREFEILKFRTLIPADPAESATNWSISADPRIGPVGRFLRKTSLDELPQVWNVLRGQMSLVGPRPERPFFVARFTGAIRHYSARHRVPAGLTGLAQVNGLRGDTSIAERARYDNMYIESWSLWSDFKIMLRTLAAVFTGRGG